MPYGKPGTLVFKWDVVQLQNFYRQARCSVPLPQQSLLSSKVTNFNPLHLHLSPPQGVILFEFRRDLWYQKTCHGLSCGVVCVILRLAVLIQYRSVTDTQTHDDGIYRAQHSCRAVKISFFNKINNSTVVNTLKQFYNRRDCKIFCTNVPQTDTFDQDVSHGNRKSTQLTSWWIIRTTV